jgi:hypothetical protein
VCWVLFDVGKPTKVIVLEFFFHHHQVANGLLCHWFCAIQVYIEPSAQVLQLGPNLEHGAWVKKFVVLQQKQKKISPREQDGVVFQLELNTIIC